MSASRSPSVPSIPFAWIVAALTASLGVVTLLMTYVAIGLQLEPALDIVLVGCGTMTVAALVHLRRPQGVVARILRDLAEYVACFSTICLVGALATYPIAALSHGYVDGALAAADRALGFDWLTWYGVVARHPWLQLGGRAAYQSIYLSPAILFGWFAATGNRAPARRFLASFWLAAVLALGLFALLPCRGPLAIAALPRLPYLPLSALYQADIIAALRDHQLSQIPLGSLRGLVGAPSFHTASAVLYIAAAWPIARLRWPLLALNLLMLLATPVEGTHYLADMLIGGVVAAAALAASRLVSAAAANPGRRPTFVHGVNRTAPISSPVRSR